MKVVHGFVKCTGSFLGWLCFVSSGLAREEACENSGGISQGSRVFGPKFVQSGCNSLFVPQRTVFAVFCGLVRTFGFLG